MSELSFDSQKALCLLSLKRVEPKKEDDFLKLEPFCQYEKWPQLEPLLRKVVLKNSYSQALHHTLGAILDLPLDDYHKRIRDSLGTKKRYNGLMTDKNDGCVYMVNSDRETFIAGTWDNYGGIGSMDLEPSDAETICDVFSFYKKYKKNWNYSSWYPVKTISKYKRYTGISGVNLGAMEEIAEYFTAEEFEAVKKELDTFIKS